MKKTAKMNKSLREISWQVSEDEYRADPALSYSTLAKYERTGFNGIATLFDKVESPSLTFGSAVDSVITGGQTEFEERFMVAEYPSTPDNIVNIVTALFKQFGETYADLYEMSQSTILPYVEMYDYQRNWKAETRVNKVKELGNEYYKLLHLAGDKKIINTETYNDVNKCVQALCTNPSTRKYFAEDNPWDSIERLYQLKFKATLNNVDYRCMADLIVVDHQNKIVIPVDLKTSSKPEWDFYKSFLDWSYHIQARLYWRIIRDNLDRDPYFKDFQLVDYRFIVVNRNTLTPLVWKYPQTKTEGEIVYGRTGAVLLRDPETIGKELHGYLTNINAVPQGISVDGENDLTHWLNKI